MNCVYCGEYDLVGDVRFSQEDASQTHQSVREISVISWLHHPMILSEPPTHPPKENCVSIHLLANE